MKGKVIAVEDARITVLVPDGLAVLELIDRRAVAIGDIVEGDLGSLGAARVLNESRQIEFDAYVEDCSWLVDDFAASSFDIEH